MHKLRNKDKNMYRFLLRFDDSLRKKMVEIGERESRSLNYLINEAIAEYVERHSSWGDAYERNNYSKLKHNPR